MERPLMTISITLGGMTVTAKNQDIANLQAAINEELKLYATKAEVRALEEKIAESNERLFSLLSGFEDRIGTIEQTPMSDHGHAALEERVDALENLIQRVPAENPQPVVVGEVIQLPRPASVDPNEVSLVYDKATLYLGDMVLHAQRIEENRWRLFAQLNFVVVSPVSWTYDEIREGTPEEIYEHASRRLRELAELKPQHDAVHERVREMSEGN